MDAEPIPDAWHLDKRVPLALILAIVLQTCGLVWWASSLDTRVLQLERAADTRRADGDRLTRVEGKLDAQGDLLARIDHRLERIEDRRVR